MTSVPSVPSPSSELLPSLVRLNKPKKRAALILVPNKKLFVLGLDEERDDITIIGYDVTYEHLPNYDLEEIRLQFIKRRLDFDKFAFVGHASTDTLTTLTRQRTAEITNLPAHLLENWKLVMGNNALPPHHSYFCLDASELGRLDRPIIDVKQQWAQLCPELQCMLDERNMIFVM